MDTGEIMADRKQLSVDARTTVEHISRAMTELTKIGAIIKEKRGRKTAYFVNPNVGWAGGEGSRVNAAKGVPKLRLVAGGKVEPDGPMPTYEAPEGLIAAAIRYLRSADLATRKQWATVAIEHGAPEMPSMTDKKLIPKWAKFAALDLEEAGLLPPEQQGDE